MRILFFSSFPIYKNNGGVQRVTSILAYEFVKLGCEVIYLTTETGTFEIIEGIKQYYLPNQGIQQNLANIDFTKGLIIDNQINVIINQAGVYGEISEFINLVKNHNIKVLTVHHNCISCLQDNYRNIILGNDGSLTQILKKLDYKPIWDILKYYNKFKYGKFFKRAIEVADKLVLLSTSYCKELNTFLLSWPENKIVGIPNPSSFEPHPEFIIKKENRLLYVGRIEYAQKQADMLIDIWEKIYQKYPDWYFDIIGDGSKLNELKEKVAERKLKRIYFHGYQNPVPYFEKAKILLLTSSFEGFGMVLIEAQSYGVVPISFNCFSSIEDIITKKTGKIVPASNLIEYITELEMLISNENYRAELAYNGLNHSTEFNAKKIASQWIQLINSIGNEK